MAGRGPQSFKKRQKEQQRKEKQQEKASKRLQRKSDKDNPLALGGPDSDIEELEEEVDQMSADEIAERLVAGKSVRV
jgi:hypothetical protein